MSTNYIKFLSLVAGLLFVGTAWASTQTDNFTGTKAALDWNALGYSCLTVPFATGSIPSCPGASDVSGAGALRLTPAATSQAGAILSNFTFPNNAGIRIIFTTYTYGGDYGGSAANGADGIAFFLTDGSFPLPKNAAGGYTAGGLGGSLGYSCSNINGQFEGIANAYLGLGIDEFGNYLNSADNTNTGIYNSNDPTYGVKTYGTNSYSYGSPQYQPERIGLRGAGNLTWAWLKSMNPTYYTGTIDAAKTKAACSSGQYVVASVPAANQNSQPTNTYASIPLNYNAIAGGYSVLPAGILIANEKAKTRASAIPITYKLNISSDGLLDFSYSINSATDKVVLANYPINKSNGNVPAVLRFGFSAGTGGSYNVHEITCFSASPLLSNSSVGANTVQSGQYRTGSQLYLATYTKDNWWGSVVSDSVTVAADGSLAVAALPNWDANCNISGGPCPSLGTDAQGVATTSKLAQPTILRVLLSSSTTGAGVPFEWVNGIDPSQKANLTDSGDTSGTSGLARLNWLRGVRTNEQLVGTLRKRTQVLGDIVNSSPMLVAAPAANIYPDAFTDSLLGSASIKPENASGAQVYSAFVSAKSTRLNVVYAGSNDGFMHAFAAGPPGADSSGKPTYNASSNNGTEVLGFMPAGVLSSSGIVNLTSPLYVHNYFVDATPAVGDLFYGGKWHTWLVGGVGSAGSEVYALDVTDPTQFTEINAASLVAGDWNTANTSTLTHLGTTTGTPLIVRLHNGKWAIIFGNGLGTTATAGVYVGLIDPSSGAVTFQFLDTAVGSSATPNGITSVTSVDLDGDKISDYLYAGDILGNLWRFDMTSADPAKWVASTFGGKTPVPLFVAKSAGATPAVQPITTASVVASVAVGGGNRVMVLFGTGQKTPYNTLNGDVYASGSQTFYGIWDWDLSAWNTASKLVNPNAQYVALSGTQAITRASLLAQTLTSETATIGAQVQGYRNLSIGNVVCWNGSTTCTSGDTQYGWLFDLPGLNEQIIYNPVLIGGAAVVNTAIPVAANSTQCITGSQTGWTMAFDPASGGGIVQSFFPDANGSTTTAAGSTVGGIRLDGVGSPTSISYNGQSYLVTQTVSGTPAFSKIYPPNNSMLRVSWKEMRH